MIYCKFNNCKMRGRYHGSWITCWTGCESKGRDFDTPYLPNNYSNSFSDDAIVFTYSSVMQQNKTKDCSSIGESNNNMKDTRLEAYLRWATLGIVINKCLMNSMFVNNALVENIPFFLCFSLPKGSRLWS